MGDDSGQGGVSKIRGEAEAHADGALAELKRQSPHVVPSISPVDVGQVPQQLSDGDGHGGRHDQKKKVSNVAIHGEDHGK